MQQAIQTAREHHQAGRLTEAERICRQVLQSDPEYPDALNLLGVIAHQAGKDELAVDLIGQALSRDPANPKYLNNLGEAHRGLGRPAEALAYYDKALAIEPGHSGALVNRGNALQELRRHDEALVGYDRVLTVEPGNAEAWSNRGVALQELKRHGEALASYDRALAIKPGYAAAHLNMSTCLLVMGHLEHGWREYEWRWQGANPSAAKRNFSRAAWLGKEDIAGKTILLHAEQGLGDTIQFSRYAQAVAGKGARVILEVQPILKSLMSSIPGVHQVLGQGEPLPEVDFHCPMLSLPLAFDTRLETIPATNPYLSVDKAAVGEWRRKLAVGDARLVGLCWQGNRIYKKDQERSVRLARLRPLLACPGVRFVSLQKELEEEERAIAAETGNFIHPGADFKATAEMIGALDLVISVDTAWAHLAGAIGTPLWVLIPFAPHWCWHLDRDDSPWYPTARLFRQPRAGDWDSVIDRVQRELSR